MPDMPEEPMDVEELMRRDIIASIIPPGKTPADASLFDYNFSTGLARLEQMMADDRINEIMPSVMDALRWIEMVRPVEDKSYMEAFCAYDHEGKQLGRFAFSHHPMATAGFDSLARVIADKGAVEGFMSGELPRPSFVATAGAGGMLAASEHDDEVAAGAFNPGALTQYGSICIFEVTDDAGSLRPMYTMLAPVAVAVDDEGRSITEWITPDLSEEPDSQLFPYILTPEDNGFFVPRVVASVAKQLTQLCCGDGRTAFRAGCGDPDCPNCKAATGQALPTIEEVVAQASEVMGGLCGCPACNCNRQQVIYERTLETKGTLGIEPTPPPGTLRPDVLAAAIEALDRHIDAAADRCEALGLDHVSRSTDPYRDHDNEGPDQ